MDNVISLKAVREKKSRKIQEQTYKARIQKMNKLELLEEMVQFQHARAKEGELTETLMLEGQILFKALEKSAETQDLKDLARSYSKHLKCELNALKKKFS